MAKLNLSTKSKTELESMLIQNRTDLARLKFDRLAKKIKNPREFGKIRRNIARILTQIRLSF